MWSSVTLDRWVAEEGAGVATYGKVGDAVRARLTENKKMFPNYWFEFVSKRAANLFEDFVKLFPEMSDPISIEQLHGFAHGGHTDGLAYLVAQEFADVAAEIISIDERIRANKVVSDRIKKQVPPDLDQEDKLKELDRERRSLRKIGDDKGSALKSGPAGAIASTIQRRSWPLASTLVASTGTNFSSPSQRSRKFRS
jgi:DEAD/DEAH box helicase domain-containing protein